LGVIAHSFFQPPYCSIPGRKSILDFWPSLDLAHLSPFAQVCRSYPSHAVVWSVAHQADLNIQSNICPPMKQLRMTAFLATVRRRVGRGLMSVKQDSAT